MQIVSIIHQSVDMMEEIAVKVHVIRIMHFIHVVQINHMNASLKIDNIILIDFRAVVISSNIPLVVVLFPIPVGEDNVILCADEMPNL